MESVDNVPNVSIAIVSYNTRSDTQKCLASIYESTGDNTFEIIVVDNASNDGSADAIREAFPCVRIIESPENVGFARAVNQAIAASSGRLLLLLNPDTVVYEGAIDRAVRFIDQHERAGVVGCRAVFEDGSLQRNAYLPPGILNLAISRLGLHRLGSWIPFFGRENMDSWDYASARRVPVVAGCFMLVRRAAIEEVGVMDERFFMYSEEVDWCMRFQEVKWEVWYTPDATIQHMKGRSTGQQPVRMRLERERSMILFLKKYHTTPYVLMCRALLVLGLLIRTPVYLARALLGGRNRALRGEIVKIMCLAGLYVGVDNPRRTRMCAEES